MKILGIFSIWSVLFWCILLFLAFRLLWYLGNYFRDKCDRKD